MALSIDYLASMHIKAWKELYFKNKQAILTSMTISKYDFYYSNSFAFVRVTLSLVLRHQQRLALPLRLF